MIRKLSICLDKNHSYLSLVAEVAKELCTKVGFDAATIGIELEDGKSLLVALSLVVARQNLLVSEECLTSCLECLGVALRDA
jgi:hypothetical protein